ncbi:hypothetical protein GCK32_014750, partial [Trichostrongylus colubriformis]
GSFGAVYKVEAPGGKLYALKAESVSEKVPLLRLELLVMQRLQARNATHMPDLIDKGNFENFNYIVMKLLGKSLQCLEAIEELHWAGFLHRNPYAHTYGNGYDVGLVGYNPEFPSVHNNIGLLPASAGACWTFVIEQKRSTFLRLNLLCAAHLAVKKDVKPGNFVVGRAEDGDLRKLYILDFGMCRKFVDNNNVMLQPRKKAPFRGTPRYAPIASHMGKEHCRKDDVESW